MMNKRAKAFGALAALLFAFGAGIFLGGAHLRSAIVNAASTTTGIDLTVGNDTVPSNVDVSQLWRAWNLLQENYVQTHSSSTVPTPQEQLWGAIDGLTRSYGDPYTVFMPPEEAQAFQEQISGAFEGVGMEMGLKDGKLVVIAPLKDSPADRAGVKSGDFVVAVDGKPTDGQQVDDAVKLIRGKKGTTVKLTIERAGESTPRTISIVRDTISIPIIKNELDKDGIYEISMYSFSATSPQLFRDALRGFIESGSHKLILDLRGNPGGYLEAAVDMASFFLPSGDVIVTEDFKGHQDNVSHRSAGYNVFAGKGLKMAVLVDQGSASASEILAGALQQHDVAKLVGTRTFGKGSVQELLQLGGGAQLKVTIARWLTPNGTSISDGGLTPDILATTTEEEIKAGEDPQKDAAIKYLLGQK
jgi:carboxyl-terminal processing protease